MNSRTMVLLKSPSSERKGDNEMTDDLYWAEYDGVHPSKVGMQIIADLIVNKLRSYLFE